MNLTATMSSRSAPVADEPGRCCPLSYRYAPSSLARAAEFGADTLYVVGGLYGNPFALDALDALLAAEPGPTAVVFNGDFHWFDAEPALFRRVDARVRAHRATCGNVESEIARPSAGAGCGCAYPEWVDDAVVARSNRIMTRLRGAAGDGAHLAALAPNAVADVGGVRIGIVHGDATSLAGWGFSRESLATPAGIAVASAWLEAAGVGVFASSHTCEPVLRRVGPGLVVNNGAAGMPNLAAPLGGIVTRIATTASPVASLYGVREGPLHVDAMALGFDRAAWWETFTTLWPPGSDAHESYASRIRGGTTLRRATLAREADG